MDGLLRAAWLDDCESGRARNIKPKRSPSMGSTFLSPQVFRSARAQELVESLRAMAMWPNDPSEADYDCDGRTSCSS